LSKDEKWYLQIWFVILMLIVFSPVGLVLMWLSPKFNKIAKIIISLFFAILFIKVIVTQEPSTTTIQPTNQTEIDKQAQEAKKIEEQKKKELEQKKTEEAKKAAEEKNKQLQQEFKRLFDKTKSKVTYGNEINLEYMNQESSNDLLVLGYNVKVNSNVSVMVVATYKESNGDLQAIAVKPLIKDFNTALQDDNEFMEFLKKYMQTLQIVIMMSNSEIDDTKALEMLLGDFNFVNIAKDINSVGGKVVINSYEYTLSQDKKLGLIFMAKKIN